MSAWKTVVHDRPGAEITEHADLYIYWADSEFPLWNSIFVRPEVKDAATLRDSLAIANAYMSTKTGSGSVYVCGDMFSGIGASELDDLSVSTGMVRHSVLTGMIGSVPQTLSTPRLMEIHCRRVADECDLALYGHIHAQAYSMTDAVGRSAFAGSRLWTDGAFVFIGYHGDAAVSTAAVLVNKNTLYLTLVATLPQVWGKGFATATVRHALKEASHSTGIKEVVLHSTRTGCALYRRLGFRRTTHIHLYTRPRELALGTPGVKRCS
ncbi:GNAT family N-acetyltransferase [Pseudomonas matsuisoli]|uniref:N-acetyltransferase domain-containing protein n=1 Tax=Pseudomonas matsuisoli TaxID=1515666 RepID=A0A917V1F9_9PSED|nr:GNAT family N-acetyltransferase [Pseudomonas matsuisoli]GGK08703.1 hypothetical protein GCM10009304_38460 [Pseudomonas matsuisoli]